MEIIYNPPLFAQEGAAEIPAGTFCVLPTEWCDAPPEEEGKQWDYPTPPFPDYLLICDGQSLKRELYPGWSAPYSGGFYDFTLPNLRNAFVVGFTADNQPIWGTGCVYFKSVPEDKTPPRHQQLLD